MHRLRSREHTYRHRGYEIVQADARGPRTALYYIWRPQDAPGQPCRHVSGTLADARRWINSQALLEVV